MSGLPELGVAGVWLAAVFVNGVGEEAGWRGFLLPSLRARTALVPAAAQVTVVWGLWHLPLFWLLVSYRGFNPFVAAGFVVGLGAGSVVLAHVYERCGSSILAAAVWHGTYNLAVATGDDPVRSAAVTALVIAWAILIARSEGPRQRR
jgi:membrane protease YdiL (CAAX protease family)